MKVAIITGASSGIGREFAFQIDANFKSIDEIWLVSRSKEKLTNMATKLEHKTRIFAFDITDDAQLDRLEYALEYHSAKVCFLVNAAGYGLMGNFENRSCEDEAGMVRLNCEALTKLTHLCIPYMGKNSRIIQLASSAGFLPQPGFAVYAASKAYVLNFSRALNEELKPKGITVTAVCPGPVDTPFMDLAYSAGEEISYVKKMSMATPEDVVSVALRDSYLKKEVSTYGGLIKALRVGSKLLPDSVFIKAMEILR